MLGEQSTKSQILEATIALLKGGGESAVKVGLIAEELGIAAPSLYHHFANRAELIRAAYAEWYWQCLRIDGATPELAAVAETQEQYEATLRASIMWSYQASRHEARSVRMAVLGAAQNDPLLASEINSVNRNFLNGVAQSITYGAHGQIIGRVVAEMDNEIVNFAEWDKISIDAMLGVIRKRT
jgi:AcrR family transcriptional regulator